MEASRKTREKTGSEVKGGGIKIGGVKLVKGKKSKNSAKAKILKFVKATSPGTALEARRFLTPKARLAFIWLGQAFTEAPILHHFYLERHIRIETDASGYGIGRMLSQLTSDQRHSESDENFSSKFSYVGQWHPMAFSLGRWFLQRLGTRLTIRTYWPSLRPWRIGATTWGAANTRSSSSPTITISADSWILRAWVPRRSDGPRNSLGTTFESTIARKRPMPPLMPCLAFPREARPRKRPFELRTPRFFTAYSLR